MKNTIAQFCLVSWLLFYAQNVSARSLPPYQESTAPNSSATVGSVIKDGIVDPVRHSVEVGGAIGELISQVTNTPIAGNVVNAAIGLQPLLTMAYDMLTAETELGSYDAAVDGYVGALGAVLDSKTQQFLANLFKNAIRELMGLGTDGGNPGELAEEGMQNADTMTDPLVLDLDGDGFEFIPIEDSKVKFDLSGDDFATKTAWPGPNDGFLVLDRN